MKKYILLCVLCFLCGASQAQKIRIKTGIEVLKDQNFKCLEGKRVGLITNPTGVDNQMKSTIDILHEAPNVNLVALFGPEHGVRGDVHAGDHVTDIKDATTGLPVYSLYGKTRKATPEMLIYMHVLVYDIQDIGCRSFTYISTMGLAMEAAAENGKEFIVLDRPNPVGGLKIEGNLVEDDCISFVSQFKIPYLYGLTCGELALMLNGEKMMAAQCNLHVVKMKGWKRKMDYVQTGLQWVPSSPHIPHPHSAIFYPVSGILGELGYMSIGVGYTIPFQMFAAQWVEAEKLAGNLNALNVPGVVFRVTMGTLFSAYPPSALGYILSSKRYSGGTGIHVHRSRLYDTLPDVRRTVGRSRKTGGKPERIECAGCRIQADVSETLLLRG